MEKFLDNVEMEKGTVSIFFNYKTKKPVSICFYPDELSGINEDSEFAEIMIKDIPQLMTAILSEVIE